MANELARYTESDWNVDSIPHVEEKGVEADGLHSYLASKTLAEKVLNVQILLRTRSLHGMVLPSTPLMSLVR